MEAVAKLKNCPMSPRKMRLVADNIRGMKVDKALAILKHTKKEAGVFLEKLLLSAISNWENKLDHAESAADYDLYVKTIFVDGGTFLKRLQTAPQGRAHRVRKRTNHVTLIVENKVALESEGVEEVAEAAE